MRRLSLLCLSVLLACGDKTQEAKQPAVKPSINPTAAVMQLETLSRAPAGIEIKGDLDKVLRWHEADGEHVLVASHGSRAIKSSEIDEGVEDWVFAAQYLLQGQQYQMLWQLNDSSGACPVDHLARFYQQGIQVTDLDGNGQREVTLAYRLQCAGDISPMRQKVILRERERKYALRGQTLDLVVENRAAAIPDEAICERMRKAKELSFADGCIESEAEFAHAPKGFLAHARQVWRKVLLEPPVP